MSAFIVENHVDQGYVLATLTSEWNTQNDAAPLGEAIVAAYDTSAAPVWLIINFTESSWGLDDAIFGANFATRTGIQFLTHEQMREFIVVGGSGLVNMAAKGLSNELFGGVPSHICETLDDAFEYIQNN